jgi:site-specific DNA-methyltransferase (adenine-specific)
MLTITNEDNMELMARYPDKFFDLAIVDPPYGVNIGKQGMGIGGGFNKHKKEKSYKRGDWDSSIPSKEYFDELFRVSKNQIIWGGNYMTEFLPPKSCWIFWDKKNGASDFGDGELAWTSFKSPIRKYEFLWAGCFQGNMKDKEKRIHPTQKPRELYKWLLDKYAQQGDKILDTHLGSGSIAIACHDYGFDLTACELDKEYFDKAMQRITNHTNQLNLFI